MIRHRLDLTADSPVEALDLRLGLTLQSFLDLGLVLAVSSNGLDVGVILILRPAGFGEAWLGLVSGSLSSEHLPFELELLDIQISQGLTFT